MRTYPILLLIIGLSLAACDGTGGPSEDGTLVVSTSTGGTDPDPDGYQLTVDGLGSHHLDPTGTSRIDLSPGQHTLRLLGMAEHCSVSPVTPLDVDVPSRDTARVAFEVTCLATGVRITTTTAGLDFDPDGYRVEVDGTDLGVLPSNGTVLTRLDPGSRTIALGGLSPNCTIQGSGSNTVTIVDRELAQVEFAVICTATRGVIGVVVEASGVDVDGAYKALVDGTPFPVALSWTAYLPPVPAGEHVVSLVPPANCSVETEPQLVTVAAGGLIRDTVRVTFSVTCRPGSGTLRVTASITGPIPAHGFDVWVCPSQLQYYCDYGGLEQFLGTVEPNETLIAQVSPTTYNVELRGLDPNCRVNAPNPKRGVNVPNGSTISILFPVVCQP